LQVRETAPAVEALLRKGDSGDSSSLKVERVSRRVGYGRGKYLVWSTLFFNAKPNRRFSVLHERRLHDDGLVGCVNSIRLRLMASPSRLRSDIGVAFMACG
jgi:hypothetical protein